KRLMNHRAYRSADVTQGYLHFSADELREPARLIEEKILKEASLFKEDNKIENILKSLSNEEKRKLYIRLSEGDKKDEL
ncbi:integrase, partial [Salmonella enterica subsp. enterica serovar Antsalova]|nr:integrase [Salmonella enterica subsp. enterica serovar Antsalova]